MRKKTKNLPVCRQMAKRKLLENKMQCICIMAAVVLTTVLFTVAFSAAFYFRDCIRAAEMEYIGWSAHAAVSDVTDEQYSNMCQSSLASDISCYLHLGYLKEDTQIAEVELGYYEDKMASWMGYSPSRGRMPRQADEIVLSSRFLQGRGVAYEQGMQIHLRYSVNEYLYEGDFAVCGVYEKQSSLAETAMISKEFYDEALKGASGQEKMESAFGMRVAAVMFPNARHLEQKMGEFLEEAGAAENKWILNQAYGMGTDAAVVFVVACVMLLIMFCGYMIIYNIYYISVMQDTRFYGLLSTLGFLENEIRQVVKHKTNIICGISIPVGLAAGFLLSVAILPFMWEPFGLGKAQVQPNLLLFVFAAFFSYITVRISSRKPAGMAAKMSPVAARKYMPVKVKKKTGKGQGARNGYKMHVMAWRNIVRERKKSVLICCSLALCIILTSVFYTISHGVSLEQFLEGTAVSDFIVGSRQYFNRIGADYSPLEGSLVEQISQWDGIQASGGAHVAGMPVPVSGEAAKRYQELAKELGWEEESGTDGRVYTWVYGLDEYISHQMQLVDGELDWEKFATGDYVITDTLLESGSKQSYYAPGDKLRLNDGDEKEYTVLAVAQIPYDYTIRSQYAGSVDLYLPSQEWVERMQSEEYYLYAYDVEDSQEAMWESGLSELTMEGGNDISYESRETYRKQFEQFFSGLFLLGSAVSIVLGAIGILNFVNVIYSSIYERRRELAVMQSMGMSRKQVYGMLVAESGYYMAVSWLAGIAAGVPLGYFVVTALGKDMEFFRYQCRLAPYIVFGIGGCLLAVCVPCLIFYQLDKKEGLLYRLQKGMR